jgi:hypothetical protein
MVAPIQASKRVDVLREHRKKTAAEPKHVTPEPTLTKSHATEEHPELGIPSEEELLGEHIRIFLRHNPWCPEDAILEIVGLPALQVKNQLQVLKDAGFLKSVPHNNSQKFALG